MRVCIHICAHNTCGQTYTRHLTTLTAHQLALIFQASHFWIFWTARYFELKIMMFRHTVSVWKTLLYCSAMKMSLTRSVSRGRKSSRIILQWLTHLLIFAMAYRSSKRSHSMILVDCFCRMRISTGNKPSAVDRYQLMRCKGEFEMHCFSSFGCLQETTAEYCCQQSFNYFIPICIWCWFRWHPRHRYRRWERFNCNWSWRSK